MPPLLKRDALCLLEGGIETYLLALCGTRIPNLRPRRILKTRYAPVIGLYGSCVELLSKACLVQAKNKEIILQDNGFYKYGSEIIDEFRKVLKENDEDFDFLWKDTEEPTALRDSLFDLVSKFRMLQTLRANGLHAGIGPSRDVVILIANDVYDFVRALSQSKKLNPYLRNIPAPETPVIHRGALIEDLARRLSGTTELEEKANLLRAIYLVLPHVPELQPEWLDKFDKVNILPKEDDFSYLMTTLTEAHGIHFFRQRGAGEGIPFYIDQDNPNSIPISLYFLKREITQIPHQFYADVGNANGRLKQGILDLPPEDFLLDLYVIGLDKSNICQSDTKLTAQQVWPFIATALSTQGTPRPYWFFINWCDELKKLKAILKQAVSYGNAYFRKRINEVLTGIDCLIENKEWPNTYIVIKEINDTLEGFQYTRELMGEKIKQGLVGKYKPEGELLVDLNEVLDDSKKIGTVLEKILEKESLNDIERYWAKLLSRFIYRFDEKSTLLAVLRTYDLVGFWTSVRKAMRLNDLIMFGPIINGIERDVV